MRPVRTDVTLTLHRVSGTTDGPRTIENDVTGTIAFVFSRKDFGGIEEREELSYPGTYVLVEGPPYGSPPRVTVQAPGAPDGGPGPS